MPAITPSPSVHLTVKQVCAACNISRQHLYVMWQRGTGPRRLKLGRKVLVAALDLQAWLDAQEVVQ